MSTQGDFNGAVYSKQGNLRIRHLLDNKNIIRTNRFKHRKQKWKIILKHV